MFRDAFEFKRAKYCSKQCYLQSHKKKFEIRKCEHCSKEFEIAASNKTRTCSWRCSYEIRKKYGTAYVTTQGYVAIKTHSRESDENGYELAHRMIMAKKIGRQLTFNEHVHHINGNKQDNTPENLMLLTNSEHQRVHDASTKLNTKEAIENRIISTYGFNSFVHSKWCRKNKRNL